MNELKCPKCGEVFTVEDTTYAALIAQVRNKEFTKDVDKSKEAMEKEREVSLAAQKAELEKEHNEEVLKLKAELELAKREVKSEKSRQEESLKAAQADKDAIIARLNETIRGMEEKGKLSLENERKNNEIKVQELNSMLNEAEIRVKNTEESVKQKVEIATGEKEREIARLTEQIKTIKTQEELKRQEEVKNKEKEISEKEKEVAKLTGDMNALLARAKLELQNRLREKDGEIQRLSNNIILKEKEFEIEKSSLQNNFNKDIKRKEEEIASLKDYKTRLSTKMIGESLEVWCSNEFNKIRMTAYPSAYFEKDNDAKMGSKGDFIFREKTSDGIEVISIMFEMKNEMDTTSTKHKNEDFFEKLDKDRKNKNCEYAVLVSMLEEESELYNTGIVDVSYKYEKMFVVRPQFFLTIIALLRGSALNSLQYKREVRAIEIKNADLKKFQDDLTTFRTSFTKNTKLAGDRFTETIKQIDKAINDLQGAKKYLLLTGKNLNVATKKLEGLTVKKLTKGNPTLEKMFMEVEEEDAIEGEEEIVEEEEWEDR